jgi:hypothetical protein
MVEAEGADMRAAAVEAAITAAVVEGVFIAAVAGARAGLMAAIAAARDRVTQACPEGALGAWAANRGRANRRDEARLMGVPIVRRDGTRLADRQRDEAAKAEVPKGELGKEDRAEWPGHPERAAGWMDAAA